MAKNNTGSNCCKQNRPVTHCTLNSIIYKHGLSGLSRWNCWRHSCVFICNQRQQSRWDSKPTLQACRNLDTNRSAWRKTRKIALNQSSEEQKSISFFEGSSSQMLFQFNRNNVTFIIPASHKLFCFRQCLENFEPNVPRKWDLKQFFVQSNVHHALHTTHISLTRLCHGWRPELSSQHPTEPESVSSAMVYVKDITKCTDSPHSLIILQTQSRRPVPHLSSLQTQVRI